MLAATAPSTVTAFENRWRCEGSFVASGKRIASELAMTTNPVSGVFVVRHDGTTPAVYHNMDTWTVDPDGNGLHAAVLDPFSGLRVFSSPPVRNGVIGFRRPGGASPQEEFRYTLIDTVTLRVDWSVSRQGASLQLGDTLACRREDR